eukprot:TRINITY_DN51514_c0_g1_i1.p1 TRINITY_DN51514_c0_g1~~TRINITY_DN51514_c0_g1_i1.p1  ORF type:complete len:396 (-),score=14.64 TRINITY_DN51514_c0_g1_i1:83-1270(-)
MPDGKHRTELEFGNEKAVLKFFELKKKLHYSSNDNLLLWLLDCGRRCSHNSLSILPSELHVVIFSYLDFLSLRSAARVSKHTSSLVSRSTTFAPLTNGTWTGLYVVGGICAPSEPLSDVARFDPIRKAWHSMTPMHEQRYHCAAAVVDREVYVLGGRNLCGRLRSVEKYNPITKNWTPLPDMSSVRSAPAVVAFKGRIYVFGGFDGQTEYHSVECFDPEQQKWIQNAGKVMPVPACEMAAVAVNSAIYIIGGTQSRYSDLENVLDVCQCYTPTLDEWKVIETPMPTKRMCPAAVVLDGLIYVIGGSDGQRSLDNVDVLDPKTEKWKSVAPMNQSRSNATACVFGNEIYVAGGFCNLLPATGPLDTVEKYNPNTDRWYLLTKMPVKRDACKLVAIE